MIVPLRDEHHRATPAGGVETFDKSDAWHNRIEGGDVVGGSFATKADAVTAGRDLARDRQVELIIRNENGQIAERNSYGNDPRNVKG